MVVHEVAAAMTLPRFSEFSAPQIITLFWNGQNAWLRMSFLDSWTPAGRYSVHDAPQCHPSAALSSILKT
jgi:hypothetical protein